jgi:hypothetical protein
MEPIKTCPECGAVWQDQRTCQEIFHEMLYWEAENPSLGEVHHLMVLCYHLQHPSMYSPEGLDQAKSLLYYFVEVGVHPQQIRRRDGSKLSSQNRKWKIKATEKSRGSYQNEIHWKMVTKDVVFAGKNNYCHSVRKWAKTTYEILKATNNFGINSQTKQQN